MAEMVKVGVSFPVAGPAGKACVDLSQELAGAMETDVRLGPGGNSVPHVTVAMGMLGPAGRGALETAVSRLLPSLGGPFAMSFGPVYRERETGRYIFVDAVLPAAVLQWRAEAQQALAGVFAEPSRTSAVPHVTISCTEQPLPGLDDLLLRGPAIPPSVVDTVDLAVGGPKGTKLDILRSFPLR